MADRTTTNPQPRRASQPGGRRLFQWALKSLLVLVCLAALSVWTVTRSWFIIWQVRPELELKLGGDLKIGSAAYVGDGAFVFDDVKLRARGIPGTAGEVMTIGRATVVVDPTKMWTGRVEVKDVQLDQLLLRAAEAAHDPNSFAFMELEPDWSGERGKSMLPPRVGITSAVIEMGTYDGADYKVVGTRRVAGRLSPVPGEDGWFDFKLLEIDQTSHAMGAGGVAVQGRWNVKTLENSARVEGIQLDRPAYDMCPQMVKLWWDQMDPQGRVASATMHWKPGGGPIAAVVEIESLALTLPVQTDQVWSRYVHGRIEPSTGRPRMSVSGGTIRLEGDTLFLEDLQGELASSDETQTLAHVPYHVSLRVDSLPDIDWHNKQQWMQSVLTNAAFRMDLRMDDFSLEPGGDGSDSAIELPTPVAQGLARFQLTGWSMSSDVTVTRHPPLIDDEGAVHEQPIRMTGHASIRDAFGKYFKFPYALEGVAAGIDFSDDEIVIEELTGRGASGADVRITGRIAPLADESAVTLHVAATGVPLDEHLRAALQPETQQAFDKLFSRTAFEERTRSGVIVDDEAIEEIRSTRDLLFAELVALPEPDGEVDDQLARRRADLELRLERLERVIDTGPFHLGGLIDVDLDVERAAGDNQDTITTGRIRIRRAGVVPAMFPYPLQVLSGMLDWKADHVDIVPDEQGDGLRIATPGGGLGTITGRIDLPTIDGHMVARPELKFDVRGDHPNELLYAAIPDFQTAAAAPGDPADQSPRMSRGGALLKSLGLDAALQYTGSFRESDDGKAQYEVSVLMRDGTAAPTESLSEAIGRAGLLWPPGGTLREAAGELHITPDALELVNLVASHDGGRLEATGRVDLRSQPVQTALNVRLGGLTLDHYLLNLLPQESLHDARALWDRYQPHGTFDAQLEYNARGPDDSDVRLAVFPTDLSVTLNGEAITLSRIDGTLAIEDGRVVFNDLALGIRGATHHDGIITLAGSYGIAGAGEGLRVDGRWEGARLESPLIIEALRTIGAEEHAAGYASLEPVGKFDAKFSYQSPHDGAPRQYEFAAEPRTAAFTISGVRINAEFDEGARIMLTPGRAALQQLTGQYEAGEFAITGTVATEPALSADLRVSHRGQINEQFLALLPKEAADPIQAIHLDAGQQLHVDDATLRLSRLDPAAPGDKARWVVLFDGPVRTHGMSLEAGVKFSQADGVFHIRAGRSAEGRTSLIIDADLVRALVASREVTNAHALIELSPDGTELLVPQMRADCYGGALSAQARLGLGDNAPYSVEMELVSVGLEGFAVGDAAPAKGPGAEKAADRGDPPSGEMFGKFTMAGLRGLSETRRGYGELRVVRGRMANMPLTLRIVQLLALMLPITDSLDFADVGFYMQGDRAVFERFFLAGPTIALVGDKGQMNLDTFDLNLRFRPRGTLPVMSELVGGVSDQFFVIEVTGPLNDPQAGIIALPGMKRTTIDDSGAQTSIAPSTGSVPLAAAGLK